MILIIDGSQYKYPTKGFDINMTYDFKNHILTIEKNDMTDMLSFYKYREFHSDEFRNAKEIRLPDDLEDLYALSFAECINLERIKIPETVKKIGVEAFRSCERLKEIVIPEGILCIEEFTFSDCIALENVQLPDSVKVIKECAFDNCKSLESIILPKELEKLEKAVFNNCIHLREIHLPSKITELSHCLFKDCESLETVTFSSEIQTVYGNAFYYCRNLNDVEIGDNAKVYPSAFRGCNPYATVSQYNMKIPAYLYKDSQVAYYMESPSYERLLNISSMAAKAFLSVMFLERFEDEDKRFKTYVKKNLSKIIDYIAENENVEMLDILINNNVVSKKAIDKCLEYVEKNDFHEAFIMLAEYKEKIGGYEKNTEKRFEL